jgi:ABC-2 type transport system ATP-binding protein
MIEISQVLKTFGGRRGLDGFSLSVPRGALFGLVGPNGAGKTTLMKVMSGLIGRDGGSVAIDGHDPALEPLEVRAIIGYQPDFAGVYQGMRVHEYLEFFADAFRLGPRKKAAIATALMRSKLEDRPKDFVEELSFGWKQRLVLAKTLLHDPKVLLLDEPATGLDPIARIELREQLKELNGNGLTILISSHILADLEDICSHVAFIAAGKNFAGTDQQNVVDLRPVSAGQQEYEIGWIGADSGKLLQSAPRATVVSMKDMEARVLIEGGETEAAEVLRSLIASGMQVTRFAEATEGLENRYRKVFGEKQ